LCTVRLAAALSDDSAPTYINDTVTDTNRNGLAFGVGTLQFAAASAGQTLTVTVYEVLDYGGGNVGIAAATLANSSGPVLLQYGVSGSKLQLTWPSGTLLQAPSVNGPWTPTAGAAPPSFTVPMNQPQMFYRVQVQ
jgi:hypothetical protein